MHGQIREHGYNGVQLHGTPPGQRREGGAMLLCAVHTPRRCVAELKLSSSVLLVLCMCAAVLSSVSGAAAAQQPTAGDVVLSLVPGHLHMRPLQVAVPQTEARASPFGSRSVSEHSRGGSGG